MTKQILSLFLAFGGILGIGAAPGNLQDKNVNELPVVGTYENLKSIVSKIDQTGGRMAVMENGIAFDSINSMKSVQTAAPVYNENKQDYSKTNVQVEGVDEADIIKNDDKFIYHIIKQNLVISSVYPAGNMSIKSTIKFQDGFSPRELFVDKNKLVVLGSQYSGYNYTMKMPTWIQRNTSKAIIYDITNRENPQLVREVEADGDYVSSRKIGDHLYFITNKYVYSYMLNQYTENDILPIYRDTAVSKEYSVIKCDNIRYFPDTQSSNFMITVGVDLSNNSKADISTYLGTGETIYSSAENMYVAVARYENMNYVTNDIASPKRMSPTFVETNEQNTVIYKFSLKKGKLRYENSGKVPGRILNQFSMDENSGYFRIATTKGEVWGTGNNISKNNMYVLNNNMEIVGQIEDIAPGEKIYSVRFMDDRAYMVTFRKVDPLFVIDLKNPKEPKILGKLKIPGYSDYLHPYDENHIIGFGKDAEVVSNEGSWGWSDDAGTTAYYQGMKIAIFDVTDPNNPKEMFKENIGDRGTESPLLNNHKALLFSKDRNLLAFPINVATVKEKVKAYTYGETSFVGAYVYDISLDKGFILKGKLTNLTEDDAKKMGNWYYGDKSIDRLIYIKDIIYTISNSGYSAYRLDNLKKVGELEIK